MTKKAFDKIAEGLRELADYFSQKSSNEVALEQRAADLMAIERMRNKVKTSMGNPIDPGCPPASKDKRSQ